MALPGKALHGGRILIVDDNDAWRRMLGGLLSDIGYTVTVVADENEAMQSLRKGPFHLAIVDLRLDEADERNRAGLTLAATMKHYMPELAIIILSGYADVESVKKARKPKNGVPVAIDFMEKDEIGDLLPRISEAFREEARVNPELGIDLKESLTWRMFHKTLDGMSSFTVERAELEIRDVLQRIFYQANRIEVSLLADGHGGGIILLVSPERQGVAQTDTVVKLGTKQQIEKETENYEKYVAHYVGDARHTQHIDTRFTAHFGGLAYSLVGTSGQSLRRFRHSYHNGTLDTLQSIVKNLFCETCRPWYTNTLQKNSEPHSLRADYIQWLRLDRAKLDTALVELVGKHLDNGLFFEDESNYHLSKIQIRGQDYAELVSPLSQYQSPFPYYGPYCFTHGDLHENNILVDPHNQTWLIDFYHTGPAHPLRDFAMFESAIKFDLLQLNIPVSEVIAWENVIDATDGFTNRPVFHNPRFNQDLTKAAELIFYLRSLIPKILPDSSFDDYRVALYFHALKAMTLRKKLNLAQRQHALVSASILAAIIHRS